MALPKSFAKAFYGFPKLTRSALHELVPFQMQGGRRARVFPLMPNTPQVNSRPAIYSWVMIDGLYREASIIASVNAFGWRTMWTPMLDPWLDGLITIGKLAAGPGTRRPACRKASAEADLSIPNLLAADPEPVKGIPIFSRIV